MKRNFISSCALAGLAALSFTSFASCDIETANDITNAITGMDCVNVEANYKSVVAKQGSLLDMNSVIKKMEANPKDFAMAIVLNESAINKMFKAASSLTEGGVIELPTISMGGCDGYSSRYTGEVDRCLTMAFKANLNGAYYVGVTVGVPIVPDIKGNNPADQADAAKGLRTAIFADLPNAEILKIESSSGSINSIILETVVTPLVQKLIRSNFRRVSLFDVKAWEMGDGKIKLVAGGPVVNKQEHTLTLGMYSNINLGEVNTQLGETARVTWEEAFPKDAEIGLHIHPDLIRGIINLMFAEGHIKDEMSADPSASSSASGSNSFKVTLADMASYPMQTLMTYGAEWQKYFTMGVRLWNTDTLCGYMDLLAGLNVQITDSAFHMSLGNVRVGQASGIGSLVKIGVDQLTETQTFKDIINFAQLSFNYDQLSIAAQKDDTSGDSSKQANTSAVDFRIDGNGISLYLNFLDV